MRSTAILSGLAVLLLAPCVFAQQKQHFRDEQTIATWAKEAAKLLIEKEIMSGYPDGKFHGRDTISRYVAGQAIWNLLNRAMQFQKAQPHKTMDIMLAVFAPSTQVGADFDYFMDEDLHCFNLDPKELVRAGVMQGYTLRYDGQKRHVFRRKRALTHAEFAVIVSRLLQRLEHAPDLEMKKAVFKDVDGDEWWFGAALVATGTGVMSGYPDKTFRGSQFVTRNEFAVTLARLVTLAQLEKATQTPP